MTGDLQLIGDQAAWLRREPSEVRRRVLSDPDAAATYWPDVQATTAWARFVLGRRAREARQALLGRRKKR